MSRVLLSEQEKLENRRAYARKYYNANRARARAMQKKYRDQAAAKNNALPKSIKPLPLHGDPYPVHRKYNYE